MRNAIETKTSWPAIIAGAAAPWAALAPEAALVLAEEEDLEASAAAAALDLAAPQRGLRGAAAPALVGSRQASSRRGPPQAWSPPGSELPPGWALHSMSHCCGNASH